MYKQPIRFHCVCRRSHMTWIFKNQIAENKSRLFAWLSQKVKYVELIMSAHRLICTVKCAEKGINTNICCIFLVGMYHLICCCSFCVIRIHRMTVERAKDAQRQAQRKKLNQNWFNEQQYDVDYVVGMRRFVCNTNIYILDGKSHSLTERCRFVDFSFHFQSNQVM